MVKIELSYLNMDFNLELNKKLKIIIEFLNLNLENTMMKLSDVKV